MDFFNNNLKVGLFIFWYVVLNNFNCCLMFIKVFEWFNILGFIFVECNSVFIFSWLWMVKFRIVGMIVVGSNLFFINYKYGLFV